MRNVFVFCKGPNAAADVAAIRAMGVKAGVLDAGNAETRGFAHYPDGCLLVVDTVPRASYADAATAAEVAIVARSEAREPVKPALTDLDVRLLALERKAGITSADQDAARTELAAKE